MGVVLLQILQWILRIILFLLLLIFVLVAVVLIVPIRYQAEGEVFEKKPGIRGKVTWFFYLIYMKFCYEDEFRIQVRVFGIKVFDSMGEDSKRKTKKKSKKAAQSNTEVSISEATKVDTDVSISEATKVDTDVSISEATKANTEAAISEVTKANTEAAISEIVESSAENSSVREDDLAAWEKEIEAEAREEAELAKQIAEEKIEVSSASEEKEKKTFSEKVENIKSKIQDIIQKIQDIIAKIQDGKLKVEHYLELWNRKETQITFNRAKKKLGKMFIAIMPRRWVLAGEVGFDDPATTGKFMGVLGAMYPIFGNKVQVIPNFDNSVINIEGKLKGHIRLGNLLYQLVSLLLNRHCFKFIKLVFDELGGPSKGKKKQGA